MADAITYYRDRLDEYLGLERLVFTENRFSPMGIPIGENEGLAIEAQEAIESAQDLLVKLLRAGITHQAMADAFAAAEQMATLAILTIRDRRVRLCYVTCRESIIRNDGSVGTRQPFHVIARPTLRTWLNRRMMDLRIAAHEALRSLREAASSQTERIIRLCLASIREALAALRRGDLIPSESTGHSLRDMIAELLTPHILAAGTGPGLFVPRC